MCPRGTVNTSRATEFDALLGLVTTIVVLGKSKVFKRWCFLFVHHEFLANVITNALSNQF